MTEAHSTGAAAFVLAMLMSILLACSTGESQSESPDVPRAIPASEIRIVGTTDSIARIVDLAQAGDGTVWILNSVEPFFVAMTIDGTIQTAWGKQGGGPGELRRPVGLVIDSRTGDVWAYDQGRRAMVRASGLSGDPEMIALDRQRGAPNQPQSFENAATGDGRPWMRGGANGFQMARGTGSLPRSLWTAEIIEVEFDGSIEPTISLADLLADPALKYGDADDFMPFPMWAVCDDATVVVYDPVQNNIRRFSITGDEQQVHVLPPERQLELTVDRVFRMAYDVFRDNAVAGAVPDSARIYQEIEGQWEEVTATAWKYFPEYADLQCVEGKTLWLQRFDPDAGGMGRSPTWLRIAPNGTIDSVMLPEVFRPMRFDSHRIWGITTDDFGVESAAWIQYPER